MGFVTVFGGTFNPIHTGHQEIIECLSRHCDVDKILLMPTKIPPHKNSECLASANDRYNMCALVASNFSNVEVSDIELFREGISYTIDTVNALCRLYPSQDIAITIGGDMLVSFTKWKQYKEILNKCALFVFKRADVDESEHINSIENLKKLGANIISIDKPITDISSTLIRNSLKEKGFTDYLDDKVKEYIQNNNLYGV